MSTKVQNCPRCNSKYVINFKDTIECLKCRLEFYKNSIIFDSLETKKGNPIMRNITVIIKIINIKTFILRKE